ncbi:MAG: DUF4340 domain-containing protein [Clostridia bacterium]|nr:DUF4340 domain-containing protein [Clostridia bacterium]
MSINKRMIINLTVGVLVLAVLGGVYFWATGWQPDKSGEQPLENDPILLFDVGSDDISQVLINNENAEFVIKRTDNEKSDWSLENYQGIEFSQTKIQNLIENLSRISANRKIESDGKNAADFGIELNKNAVTIRTVNGDESTFVLGGRPTQDSDFYLMKIGDAGIYTVPAYKAEAILKTPNDLRENVLATIDTGSIQSLKIERSGKNIMEICYSKDADDGTYKASLYLMTYPYNEVVNKQSFETLVAAFAGVEAVQFVSDNPSDASKYGLNKGYRVQFDESGQKHTMIFGDTDEYGNVYAMYGDKQFIFTMAPDIKKAITDINPFDYIIKFAHIYALDNVSSVTVNYKGKTYTLAVQRDTNDEKKTKYRINDRSVNEKNFKKLYQSVIGLTFTDVLQNQAAGKEVCAISFDLLDGGTQTARYYECDERNVILKRHDGKKYIMLKKHLGEMIKTLEEEVK